MAKSKKQPAKRQPKTQARKQPQPSLWDKVAENKTRLAIILVLLAVPVAVFLNRNEAANVDEPQVQAQEQQAEEPADAEQEGEPAAQNEEKETAESEEAAHDESYAYVAQPNDTYSQMARKAIQTYGINHEVSLSNAQIIYAETLMTQEAGSPVLNDGQEVSIDEATVQSWVEKAGDLTDSQKSAWEAYTVGVDFNTDNIGESR